VLVVEDVVVLFAFSFLCSSSFFSVFRFGWLVSWDLVSLAFPFVSSSSLFSSTLNNSSCEIFQWVYGGYRRFVCLVYLYTFLADVYSLSLAVLILIVALFALLLLAHSFHLFLTCSFALSLSLLFLPTAPLTLSLSFPLSLSGNMIAPLR